MPRPNPKPHRGDRDSTDINTNDHHGKIEIGPTTHIIHATVSTKRISALQDEFLIKNIFYFKFDLMFSQDCQELFLERLFSMMFFLIADV